MTSFTLNGLDHQVFAFLCDTVRTEADGRNTAVGIGPSIVQSLEFPINIVSALYLRVTPPLPEGIPLAFTLQLGDEIVGRIEGQPTPGPVQDPGPMPSMTAVVDHLFLTIPGPGLFTVKMFMGDAAPVVVAACVYRLISEPEAADGSA